MRRLGFLIATLSFFVVGSAQALTVPSEFRSGPVICGANRESRAVEEEIWLRVPIDYSDLSRGTTPLYAWTAKPLDRALPTMIFVAGGPGATAHDSRLSLDGWNVVFFDQRGNSCSRPETRELYLDPRFYSSELIARDVDEIRKELGLEQISVYGVSYGTAPAQVYASLFPAHTRAIVLEGVVAKGGAELMEPERRRKTLQAFFDSLPLNVQDKILELSHHPKIPAPWFSAVGMMMLYNDEPFTGFRTFLDTVLSDESVALSVLSAFFPPEPEDAEFGFGHVLMGMIGCQELGMNLSGVSFYSVFEGRRLVSTHENHLQANYCESLGFKTEAHTALFNAADWPTLAPVTYFQGLRDGATDVTQALWHYKQAARGFAQLVLVREGGHMPINGTVASGYGQGEDLAARETVLKAALLGAEISPESLAVLNNVTSLGWTMAAKKTELSHR
jgi:proline iminopeptidase